MLPPEVTEDCAILKDPETIMLPVICMEPDIIGLSIIIFSFVYKYLRVD